MTRSLATLLVLCSLILFPLRSPGEETPAKPDCTERLKEVCQDTSADPSICQMMDGSIVENRSSVFALEEMLRHMDNEVSENVICARLMGRSFRDTFTLPSPPKFFPVTTLTRSFEGKYEDDERVIVCNDVHIPPYYNEFAEIAAKVAKYGGKIPKEPDSIELQCTISLVNLEDSHSSRYSNCQHKLRVELEGCRIVKLLRGDQSVTYRELYEEAKIALKVKMDEYMNVGHETTRTP